MNLGDRIYKLRAKAGLTQEKFAEKFQVSHQAVQKWEKGETKPDMDNLIKIAAFFGVTLDCLVFGTNQRAEEELPTMKELFPSYEGQHEWELYFEQLPTEYRQCVEEGLQVEHLEPLFTAIASLEKSPQKTKMADALFELVLNVPVQEDYPYEEPSDYEGIRALATGETTKGVVPSAAELQKKISGAWYGRIAGCLLGKPIEGIKREELNALLKGSDNFPLHRYILRKDIDLAKSENQNLLKCRQYVDTVDYMPYDDDTNYMVLYQKVIEEYGKDFTPRDVSKAWLNLQPQTAYCTAERVAYRNFVKGYMPPESAIYQNPYREWIGAQIRGDYFGYINPGAPEKAAEMAWRDACISHVKNGIYGEMFVSAMLAQAAISDDMEDIISAGLSQIPSKSRLHEAVSNIIDEYKKGVPASKCISDIHTRWDEYNQHDWCHTISNAEIVTAALLYGENDFTKSICLAVQSCFDTDCNGATVGSVMGMKNGFDSIDKAWVDPLHDTLESTVFGVGKVSIPSLVEKTMEHIER